MWGMGVVVALCIWGMGVVVAEPCMWGMGVVVAVPCMCICVEWFVTVGVSVTNTTPLTPVPTKKAAAVDGSSIDDMTPAVVLIIKCTPEIEYASKNSVLTGMVAGAFIFPAAKDGKMEYILFLARRCADVTMPRETEATTLYFRVEPLSSKTAAPIFKPLRVSDACRS
jgi:hypothetical protein